MSYHWWIVRKRSLRNALFLVGAISSVIAVFVNFLPDIGEIPWWGIALLVIAAGFAVTVIAFELLEPQRRHVFRKQDTAGILKYMRDWIKHGGRVVVWSRDMSWADDEEIKQLLERKAQRGELLLLLPSSNSHSQGLANAGAEVIYYGGFGLDTPGSRFTITHYGRDGSSLAVGRARGDTHVIDEFHAGDHPGYQIAADLVELVRSVSKR